MRGKPARCETLGDSSAGVQGCVLNTVEREMDESWWVAEFHSGVSQEQRDGISDKAPCYNSLAPCTLTPVLQTCHKERGQMLSLRSFTAAPGRSHFIKYPSGLDKHSSQLAFQLQQQKIPLGESHEPGHI